MSSGYWLTCYYTPENFAPHRHSINTLGVHLNILNIKHNIIHSKVNGSILFGHYQTQPYLYIYLHFIFCSLFDSIHLYIAVETPFRSNLF